MEKTGTFNITQASITIVNIFFMYSPPVYIIAYSSKEVKENLSKEQNKLVGSLYLDLTQLKRDVESTNNI